MENNKQINSLVVEINQGGLNEFALQNAWADLFMMVEPEMKKMVKGASNKYTRTYNIEPEQFEEAMHNAFMKAVANYDPSKGEFIARLKHITQNMFKNVVRDSQADVRKAMTGSLSLNTPLSETEEEVVTFQDQLVDVSVDVQKITEESEISVLDILAEYKTRNKRTHKEADLIEIYITFANDEERKEALMNHVGEGANWVNVRKAVSRANKNFKQALQEAGKL